MTYNDILRRFRYALNINDRTMMEHIQAWRASDGPARSERPAEKRGRARLMSCAAARSWVPFWTGSLFTNEAGRRPREGRRNDPIAQLTNNLILRKIRIALELKEDDMLGILKLANITLSRSELSAFFRDKEHKNFKACGDQVLRNFLNGLAVRYRESLRN